MFTCCHRPYARALAACVTVLPAVAAHAADAPAAGWIAVDAGVYEVGGVEYYLDAYRIQARATPGDYGHDRCEAPNPEEWLVAARQRAFTLGDAFETVAAPPEEPCAYSQQVVDAEGVEGSLHFAGLGAHLGGETKIVTGGRDPRETWVKVHSMFIAMSEDNEPSPRAWRCIERGKPRREKAFVQASRLKLRAKRVKDAGVRGDIRIGTEVAVAYRSGDWAYVEAPDRGPVMECARRGWTLAAFLGAERPNADALVAEGRKLLDAGDAAGAVPKLERAAALRPHDRAVLELLARTYRKAGNATEADALERFLANPAGRKSP